MSSFGVMCKEIGHLNQNCLLYLPAKYQGWATPWIGVISNFNDYSKWETAFLYSLYVMFLCTHGVLKRLFVRLVKPIYKTEPAQNIFTWIFLNTTHYYCYGGLSFRYRLRAICCEFGEFRKCQCFVSMHNSLYKLYYVFRSNTDIIQIM